MVVGGGCYGSYYVRQLLRAERAGALTWDALIVVDRDPACAVSRLGTGESPPRLRLVVAAWDEFFAEFLAMAPADSERVADAIVPSPLMPDLIPDLLVSRAYHR